MFTVVFGQKSLENCVGLLVYFLSFIGIYRLGGENMYMQLTLHTGAEELQEQPFLLSWVRRESKWHDKWRFFKG